MLLYDWLLTLLNRRLLTLLNRRLLALLNRRLLTLLNIRLLPDYLRRLRLRRSLRRLSPTIWQRRAWCGLRWRALLRRLPLSHWRLLALHDRRLRWPLNGLRSARR